MKQYVDVICVHERSGRILPISVIWQDGIRYAIDKITQIVPAASLKSGGCGLRYTCRFGSSVRYMYLEDDGKWFVEKAGFENNRYS